MALTKLPKSGIADDAIDASKIEDGTIQNQEIQGSLTNEKFAGSIANDRLANSSITVAGTTISLGASTTIPTDTDWQALTVADGSTQVITEAGKGYFLDTNAGVIEVFLPSSPTRGDTVILADYAGTFGTNQIIINTGGENIDSTVGSEFKITTNNAIVECVYVDAAKGWLVYLNQAAGTTPSSVFGVLGDYDTNPENYPFITATGGTVSESGDYKVHTFTGDGCFSVIWEGLSPAPSTVDYLVVAGGGGGGGFLGAGGGGGGFRESHTTCVSGPYTASPLSTPTGITLARTNYPITVGAGGSAGSPGSNSIFSTITSAGGGAGGGNGAGSSGGSGGGSANKGGVGGSGNTPPVSPPQGNNGGDANQGGERSGAGGGGAGGGGGASNISASPGVGGNGGNGVTTSITGSPVTRSGGGGGGGRNEPSPNTTQFKAGGSGGSGGGGAGGNAGTPTPPNDGTAGTPNTGGGGGGAAYVKAGGGGGNGAAGGKGIIVIRYKFQ